MSRRLAIALSVVVVLGAGLAVRAVTSGPAQITVTAHFARTPGLYAGNHVRVLGVKVGRIDAVTAGPDDVTVTMTVRRDVKVPADAHAVLMAPGVVNDRFVELAPAYTGGPVLADRDSIPMSRTAIPLDTDQIFRSLDRLLVAFGPNGANRSGVVSGTLHQLAGTLQGNGPQVHELITQLSQALKAPSAGSPALAQTLSNLSSLTQTLVDNDGLYRSFAGDLATVTAELSKDSPQLAQALSTLGTTLTDVTDFVRTNRASLTAVVANLRLTASTVAARQKELTEAFDTGPLALQDFADAIDTTYPTGPLGRVRYDAAGDRAGLLAELCGDQTVHLTRLGAFALTGVGATTFDLMCAANSSLSQEPPPPGSPNGPDLSVAALVGAR